MTEITDSAVPVDWAAAEELAITANELEKNPDGSRVCSVRTRRQPGEELRQLGQGLHDLDSEPAAS